ncbi:DciA family protein [Allopusillimonas ginsengisoli]|uniref:DciA family protein n=1 Tax=Allopusillimonas ginsengisoli TaxID=453575 RepID=UPI0010209C91|nr:DciA family protein [Allopusillimonas ginsengisoli]TEA80223.1 DUF721 domain-containing protein [Allopusillimonas ginsengisoli]
MARTHRSSTTRPHDKAQPATLAVNWLGNDQHGASVLAAARNMLAVQEAARQALPAALADACQVARIERQRITLAVPSAAYASKLRQLAPRIVHLLASRGWDVQEVSVKVQAGLLRAPTKTVERTVTPLDSGALQAFDELRSGLRPGPLADAITRLLKHHRQ